jgi:hypothetical protein
LQDVEANRCYFDYETQTFKPGRAPDQLAINNEINYGQVEPEPYPQPQPQDEYGPSQPSHPTTSQQTKSTVAESKLSVQTHPESNRLFDDDTDTVGDV